MPESHKGGTDDEPGEPVHATVRTGVAPEGVFEARFKARVATKGVTGRR
jgi:hypothetical protein